MVGWGCDVCIFFWKVSQGERGACVRQVHQILKVEDHHHVRRWEHTRKY